MELSKDDERSESEQSDIFTESIPKFGKVSMLFYIPETFDNRDTIIELIRENGGNTVKFHECFTYQLGPPENYSQHSYYQGDVYSIKWVIDCAEKGELLDNSEYLLTTCKSGLDFPFDKKKIQYTIREIVKIYEWISGRKSQASRKTWESLGNEGILFCRSKESLKNFWKNWRNCTVEDCVNQLSAKDTKYCHNYAVPIFPHKELPRPALKKGKRSKEFLVSESFKDEEEVELNTDNKQNVK